MCLGGNYNNGLGISREHNGDQGNMYGMNPFQTEPQQPSLSNTHDPYEEPQYYSGFIIVQLIEDIRDEESRTLPEVAAYVDSEDLSGVDEIHLYPSERLITSLPPQEINAIEEIARESQFPPLFSLVNSWRFDVRKIEYDWDRIQRIVEHLRAVDIVAWAHTELLANDPLSATPETNPGFPMQGYLNTSIEGGVDAIFAWDQPHGTGTGVQVADIEQGWNLSHPEFAMKSPIHQGGDMKPGHEQHGTAVLGVLLADDNDEGGIGITPLLGVPPQVDSVHVYSHFRARDASNGHVADAILAAALEIDEGDILLIEVERAGYPTEIEPQDWAAIRLASALNRIVVEAAGNRGENLDNKHVYIGEKFKDMHGITTQYLEPFNTSESGHDSGAILVSAADWDSQSSTFGRSLYANNRGANYSTRINCFGWGNGVATIGYDDPSDPTNRFSGTSAAAPIIAGAAALLQSIYRHHNPNQSLQPLDMRNVLSDTTLGTVENNGAPIGVMPDLRTILTRHPRFQ